MIKKILLPVIISLSILCGGCSKTIIDEQGNTVKIMGNYIEISKVEALDFWGNSIDFAIVYNKETKVVYEVCSGTYRTNIVPLYSYDKEGHPVFQFYKDGKIVSSQEFLSNEED